MVNQSNPSRLDSCRQFAIQVVKKLREAGHEALWAGGCVRDLLLERDPTDFDVATSARPEVVRKLFGFDRTLAVGAAFGVIIVRGKTLADGEVEVATFRNDAQYSDGRRPDSVTFSTAEEDAARRDFTINGMFYDPLAQQVIDYVGGQHDLQNGLIRAIGDADARIAEDKLRMLRAVRFAARFGFAIEAQTEAAIARHWADLRIVSGERMTIEMQKSLVASGRELAVRTWASTRLLDVLIPELAVHWPSVSEEACDLVRSVDCANWISSLAAILWPMVRQTPAIEQKVSALCQDFKQRLKFSNDDSLQLKMALTSQSTLERADRLAWSQLQPVLVHSAIGSGIALLEARLSLDQVDQAAVDCVRERMRWPSQRLNPAPLIDGHALAALGVAPGPRFKRWLQQVRDAQLDGQLATSDAALQWLENQIKSE